MAISPNRIGHFQVIWNPEKILDAPDIRDDFYLNLVDWSQNGSLAVSLASSLYLLVENGDSINLINLNNEADYISSVSWMPHS